jgi:PAS domain S-box-containing protein
MVEQERLENLLKQGSGRFQILVETSLHIGRATTLSETLRYIAEGVRQLGFDRVGIWLYDEQAHGFRGSIGTSRRGELQDESDLFYPVDEKPLFWHILQRPDSYWLTQDYQAMFNPPPGDIMEGVRANAGVPLIAGDKSIGVLAVDNLLTGHPIRDEDVQLLHLFARFAANAIETARLMTNLEASNRRYRVLFEVARSVSQSLSLRQLLDAALKTVCEEMGVNAGMVWLLDEAGRKLRLFTQYRAPQSIAEVLKVVDAPSDPIWRMVLKRRQSISLKEYPEPEMASMLKAEGFMDLAVTPLMHRDKVLGKIGLGRRDGNPFTDDELDLLTAIGNQLGIAVENAALFERTKALAQQMEAVFDTTREGFLFMDYSERILAVNKAFAQLLDVEPEFLIGKPVDEVRVRAESKVKDKRKLSEHVIAVESDLYGVFEGEFEMIDPPRILSFYSRPVFDEGGGYLGRMWVVRDITEERQRQQELLRLERFKSLGEIASGVAHDFNNTLANVLGYAQLLSMSSELKPRERQYVEHILTAARDASHIVSRMQAFYRAHKEVSTRVYIDVNDFVRQVVDLTRNRWKDEVERKGNSIKLNLDLGEVAPIKGVMPELRQVFTNLIFNAVDAMPNGGTITIRTRQKGNHACITISDTGIGMDEAIRKRAFEPFFTTKKDGTGLGLAIAYRIVNEHGGIIDVESKPDGGTTFTICLPISERAIIQEEKQPVTYEDQHPERHLRILLVDDDEDFLDLLSKMLEALGNQAIIARNGEEALYKFRRGLFDLVITDLGMPKMNGLQVAEAIHNIAPRKPVILITGWADTFNEIQMEKAGISTVLRKPITIEILQEVISKAVEDYRGLIGT